MTDLKAYGKVVKKLNEPRSYLIETLRGTYRRNRWYLIPARYHRFVHSNDDTFDQITPALSQEKNGNNDNCLDSELVSDDEDNRAIVDVRGNKNGIPENGRMQDCLEKRSETNDCNENAHNSPRPIRTRKKPSYLQDYVL